MKSSEIKRIIKEMSPAMRQRVQDHICITGIKAAIFGGVVDEKLYNFTIACLNGEDSKLLEKRRQPTSRSGKVHIIKKADRD